MLKLSFSKIISLLVGIVVTIPIFIIYTSFLNIDYEIWAHLKSYVLPELVINTIKLIIGVSLGTLCLGLPLAYFNAFFQYPGRKLFSFLAILPMSLPAYITAFVYVALFDVTGLWSLGLKNFFALEGFLPGIRNIYGVSLVLSFCFYPYVYLMAKNAFETQGRRAFEVSEVMGLSKSKTLFKIVLPLSRPWIISGLMLVIMETLADFGAVSIFNYTTFTTAIYRSWFGLFSLQSAQQLAALLVSVVFIFMTAEQFASSKKNFTSVGKSQTLLRRKQLSPIRSIAVIAFSSIVSVFAFFIPLFMVGKWAIKVAARDLDSRYFSFVFNSIEIATLVVVVLLILSSCMSYAVRKYKGVIGASIKHLSSLGYAVPGSVLAVGTFLFLTFVETSLRLPQRLLTSGLLALIVGLSIRFYSIALTPLTASFLRISDSHFHIIALSNQSKIRSFFKAIFPMIKPGLLVAALLVFVEVMKEMPMTLMTRPFGKETLAIRIFEMTSEGEWERAALPAFFLILVSLIPTILLFLQSEKSYEK